MNFLFKTTSKVGMVVILSAFTFNSSAYANAIIYNVENEADSLTSEVFLQQASSITMKEMLAANLAVEKGSDRIKTLGRTMVLRLAQVNEETRALAKLKKVALAMSTPEEGQRPDGRVDAVPDNLKDTTRNKNAGGEAGNTGHSETAINKASDVNVSKSIDNLKKLSGSAFDQAYLNMINEDKQTALPLLQHASKSSDAAIRKFAKKYLPILKKPINQLYN